MPASPAPRPIPTSYPAWVMALVDPEESKKRHKEANVPKYEEEHGQPQPQQPVAAVPATANGTPFHTAITIQDDKSTPTLEPLDPPQQQQQQLQQSNGQPLDQPVAQPKPVPPPVPARRYRTRAEQDEHDRGTIVKFARRLFAEFLGTFIFVFLVAGVALEFGLTALQVDGLRSVAGLDQTGCGWASGLTLAFLVYALGEISGAHFNPCITWAFTLRGLFPIAWLLPYWTVQFAGSILAGAFLRAFYFHNAFLATTTVNAHNQWVTGFAYEALLTFFFINVILAVATRGGNVGPHAALADGFALAVVVMIGLSYTGTAVNPFRALGPGIVNGARDDLWVYVAGPFLGSTVSVLAVWALNGPLKSEDYESAQGKGEAQASDDTPEKKAEGKGE